MQKKLFVHTGTLATQAIGLSSVTMIGAGKTVDSKIYKHEEITALTVAKRETVNRLVSKALKDNNISDVEFQLILNEQRQYNSLKEHVRNRPTRKPQTGAEPVPDLEKIKKDIREQVREQG